MSIRNLNLFSGTVTRIVFLTVIMLLFTADTLGLRCGDSGWCDTAYAVMIIATGVLLLGLIATQVVCAAKRWRLPSMSDRADCIFSVIETASFLYWVLSCHLVPSLLILWVIPVAWLIWVIAVYVAIRVK